MLPQSSKDTFVGREDDSERERDTINEDVRSIFGLERRIVKFKVDTA
jgi:hypothetical protein